MRKVLSVLFFIFTSQLIGVLSNDVGNNFPRLGDRLMSYTKTKWVSYRHNEPFLLRPFPHSDKFTFHNAEKHLQGLHSARKKAKNYEELQKWLRAPLTHVPVLIDKSYREKNWEAGDDLSLATTLMNDKTFRNHMRDMLTPIEPPDLIEIPEGATSVALHIRVGDGHDPKGKERIWPTKFPPLSFFAQELDKIPRDRNLFVHLFTDAFDPKGLAGQLEALLSSKITINISESERGILDDLFSMAEFDILIRSRSYFSQIAQLLGNHQKVIYPKKILWNGQAVQVKTIGYYSCENP